MTAPEILQLLATFESNAKAGPDREIFQAYIKDLFADGSGKLYVELASTQVRCDEERLLNRLFCPAREFTFETLPELESLLVNMELVNTSHPEHEADK